MRTSRRRCWSWLVLLPLLLVFPPSRAVGASTEGRPPETLSQLAAAVRQRISRDRHVGVAGMQVVESSGIVLLFGAIPVSSQRGRAANLAALVPGVRAVVNQLTLVRVVRPDGEIADELRGRLRGTAALSQLPIRVRVSRGVAELTGAITTLEEQQLAERVVSNVPGVRFCQNQLVFNDSIRRTDAILRGDVLSRFDWDIRLQQRDIAVSVRSSVAHLRGWVENQPERRRALRLAWVSGVTQVDARQLLVRYPAGKSSPKQPSDAEISATFSEVGPYWPALDMTQLHIAVSGGAVTLRGTVPSVAHRDAAEQVARAVVGVTKIVNELRGPWWRPPVRPTPPPPKRTTKRRGR